MLELTKAWGMNDVGIFASATLQRPYNPDKAVHLLHETTTMRDVYEMQTRSKERVKQFLADTEKIPRELMFLGRNLNLVRSNNKYLGSPVNRINMMALWAVQGIDWRIVNTTPMDEKPTTRAWWEPVADRMYPVANYWSFRARLAVISVGFYVTRWVQRVTEWMTGRRALGFEDVLDRQMRDTMREKFGIVVTEKSFDA
jgi:aarF domain-containing kinase